MKDSNLKPSNHNYIGKIPYEWNIKKLKYVIQKLKSGGTPDSSNPDYYTDDDTGIKWLSIGDMSTNDFVYETKNHITNNGVLVKNLNIFPAGTILYSIYATIGKVSELGTEAAINQAILAITPKKEMNKDYLKFSLKSLEDYAISLTSESTQKNLNANKVENFPIVFPQLREQVLIASFLDKKCSNIDSIINDLEKQIGILEKYKKSVITEAVTKGLNPDVVLKESGVEWIGEMPERWQSIALKRVTISYSGGTPSRNVEGFWENGTICWMSSGEVNKGVIFDTEEKITDLGFKSSSAKMFPPQTVVVALNGQGKTKGMSAILMIESTTNQSLIGFICNKTKLYYKYLNYIFISTYRYNRSVLASDDLRDGIAGEDLKRVKIPLPPLEEQINISEYIEQKCSDIDEIIEGKTKQIETIKKYKNSLIYEYVTGKERVSLGDVNE